MASITFPGLLREKLGGECTTTCLQCHTSPDGGQKTFREAHRPTINKYLGILAARSEDEVARAIENLGAATDTDGDEVPDLDELRTGRLALVRGPGTTCPPTYGCGARIAGHPPSESGHTIEFLIGASVALMLVQRRFRAARAK